MAMRTAYGAAYGEGDVVGCYISLPRGGAFLPPPPPEFVHKGVRVHLEQEPTPKQPVPGSEVVFFKNGMCQETAFCDVLGGKYRPAASLFTHPSQSKGCTVRFNFGPEFRFPPVDLGERPAPRPMCESPVEAKPGPEATSAVQLLEAEKLASAAAIVSAVVRVDPASEPPAVAAGSKRKHSARLRRS
eukprot:SM002594S08658  [mRNA]  locus=s2594:267:1082:- [translate_table: standard]